MRCEAKLWSCVILTFLVLTLIIPPESLFAEPENRVEHLLKGASASFIPNQGQWPGEILFSSQVDGVTLWFTQTAIYHQFSRPISSDNDAPDALDGETGPHTMIATEQERMMVAAQFVGADEGAKVVGFEPTEHLTNFMIGNDPTKWQTDIPSYHLIEYKNIYPGIDLRYQLRDGLLEYDLILAPGADQSVVEIDYQNIEELSIDADGNLIVRTLWGEIKEQAPVIFQMIDDEPSPISGSFEKTGPSSFRFELIDQPDVGYPLIIDPVITYVSSMGGSGNDEGLGIDVDSFGRAYVTGYTSSYDFPVENPFQVDTGGGFFDAFVAKVNSGGTGLVYASYLGGSSDDRGRSIAVDSAGSAYITGYTFSTDFPILNAYQSSHGGGVFDAFVVKLNPQGNGFDYSSYLGGIEQDVGEGIAVDNLGQAHIVGNTRSIDFPVINPYQGSIAGVNFDAFLTKFSSDGSAIEYSTYLGGSFSDYGRDLALDQSDNVYIVGYTKSTDFPILNPVQAENGGDFDGFVTRLSLSGEGPMFSTYLGGAGADYIEAVDIDSEQNSYVTGFTFSTDFPTQAAFQSTHGGGLRDIFVARFNNSGGLLVTSTYLGGSGEDYGYGIVLNGQGGICLTGYTYSTDFPLANPHQSEINGPNDAILTILSKAGDQLLYSTYFGGFLDDISYDIAVDAIGNTYLTGVTGETFVPAQSAGPDGLTPSGSQAEMFVTKFVDEQLCCGAFTSGLTGNSDCSVDGKRNLSDITRLIDRVYLTKSPLCCEKNGNVDGDPEEKVNLGDITRLIDHVYVSKSATAACL